MAFRTLQEIAAAVQRRTGGQATMGEIIDAISDGYKELNTSYEWPWSYAEYNVPIQGLYNTGTISVTDGTNSVSLAGGTWNSAWNYKRLYLGSNNISYRVASFTANTATLVQAVNLGTNLTSVPYTVFQDLYALPDDCDFGDILCIVNPKLRYRLRYLPTYTFVWQNQWPGTFMSNFQSGFANFGFDDATSKQLIMFAPPVGAVTEFLLVYRRRPADFATVSASVNIPQSYDRVLELLASYMVKTSRPNPIPGWMEDKTEAYQLIQKMRRRMAGSMMDVYSNWMAWPYMDNRSSVYADGLFLSGPTAGMYP